MTKSDQGSGGDFASLAAIYEKQFQDQSTLILTNAGYAFRTADSQKMIQQQLDVLNALCKTLDTAYSKPVALQYTQQCDALNSLFTHIQAADLKAISKRASLDQPALKSAAKKLAETDAQLITNLNGLSKRMDTSADTGGAPSQPSGQEQYNPGATLSWD